jgi:hypothetical protein
MVEAVQAGRGRFHGRGCRRRHRRCRYRGRRLALEHRVNSLVHHLHGLVQILLDLGDLVRFGRVLESTTALASGSDHGPVAQTMYWSVVSILKLKMPRDNLYYPWPS